MRDALSLLDLCASYSGEISAETVTEAAGLAGQDYLFAIADAAIAGKPAEALAQIHALSENSVDFSASSLSTTTAT